MIGLTITLFLIGVVLLFVGAIGPGIACLAISVVLGMAYEAR